MKLLEKTVYSFIVFLASYTVISVFLRVFEVTTVYNSHLIGGLVATVLGIGLFIYLITKK